MYEELLLELDRRQRELVFRRLEYEDSQLITVWQMRYGRSHRGKTIPDAFLDTFTDLFFLKNRWSETILKKGIKKELSEIIDQDCCLTPEECSVYSLGESVNGKGFYCKSVVDSETGMIDSNALDGVSLLLSAEFNKLEDILLSHNQ